MTADVPVHSFCPGVPSRLGISYDALRIVNPQLIYCAVTGYGEREPRRNNAGYDQVLQTMTGMSAMQESCCNVWKPGAGQEHPEESPRG